jgi:hypothetical protein
MIDILEFIDDLEQLEKLAGNACSPTFSRTLTAMIADYKERAWLTEQGMEQELEEHF